MQCGLIKAITDNDANETVIPLQVRGSELKLVVDFLIKLAGLEKARGKPTDPMGLKRAKSVDVNEEAAAAPVAIRPVISSDFSANIREELMASFPADFVRTKVREDDDLTFQLLQAANYLDVQPLVHLMSARIACIIVEMGRVANIRTRFGIVTDLSDEQLLAIQAENHWARLDDEEKTKPAQLEQVVVAVGNAPSQGKFGDVPNPLVAMILSYVPAETLMEVTLVDKRLHQLIDHDAEVWKANFEAMHQDLDADAMVQLRNAFDSYDLNKDGTITFDEFKEVMIKTGRFESDEALRLEIAGNDINNDGSMDFGEFVALIVRGKIQGTRGDFENADAATKMKRSVLDKQTNFVAKLQAQRDAVKAATANLPPTGAFLFLTDVVGNVVASGTNVWFVVALAQQLDKTGGAVMPSSVVCLALSLAFQNAFIL